MEATTTKIKLTISHMYCRGGQTVYEYTGSLTADELLDALEVGGVKPKITVLWSEAGEISAYVTYDTHDIMTNLFVGIGVAG